MNAPDCLDTHPQPTSLKDLLAQRGAYEVLMETAEWMNTELVPYHRKMQRQDVAERFGAAALKVARIAHGLLF